MNPSRFWGTLEYILEVRERQGIGLRFFSSGDPVVTHRERMKFRIISSQITAFFLLAACAVLAQSKHVPAKSAKPANVIAKPAAVPFRAGESLTYRVSWTAFSNAATVQLAIPEQRDLWGAPTWHFRAAAHTQSPVRSLFAIDDQFDSYADTQMLLTRQYEMHLNEMGKTEDDALHFAAPGQDTHAPPPLTVVDPGTRDPLDVVYALRTLNWPQTPEFRAPVYDGRQLYQIVAKRETTSDVMRVAAGNFTAGRIVIQVLQDNKEISAIHFIVWIANDSARTPVAFQANLPFGALKAELVSIQ